ncbi:hypothetical protein IWX90DRAFT_486498 [Phyllosticta citrichinensis]|uniref:Nephrocystin 3-like N-terminal domain-containing protein n=1 Tax=Phyllosticta citrichinensis TaxID=1130410 RepID=A0ABR1XTK9_9PEZI
MILLIEQNRASTPEELMSWLTESNANHLAKDRSRRWASKAKPALREFSKILEIGTALSSLDKSGHASTAVELLKSILGIAISLSDASEGIQTKINDLIEYNGFDMLYDVKKKVDGIESPEEKKIREFLGQGLKPEQAFESSLQLDETPERSFAWIHSDTKVQQWLQDENSRFLVMSGAPGCGKTTTTRYFI